MTCHYIFQTELLVFSFSRIFFYASYQVQMEFLLYVSNVLKNLVLGNTKRYFLLGSFFFLRILSWDVLGLLIFVSLSFFHYIPFPLTVFLNHCNVYQNFPCQNKENLKLDFMVFLSCNDKDERSSDLKAVVYR